MGAAVAAAVSGAAAVSSSSSSSRRGCGDASSWTPALSPEECFERVEMRFRSLLKKRHVPLGILANLEDDLTGFFR